MKTEAVAKNETKDEDEDKDDIKDDIKEEDDDGVKKEDEEDEEDVPADAGQAQAVAPPLDGDGVLAYEREAWGVIQSSPCPTRAGRPLTNIAKPWAAPDGRRVELHWASDLALAGSSSPVHP